MMRESVVIKCKVERLNSKETLKGINTNLGPAQQKAEHVILTCKHKEEATSGCKRKKQKQKT